MRFVCFSSGSQPRYRDDVIRAMAMPEGAELTFRYRLKYLGNSVQDSVTSRKINAGDEVLITYVDQSDKTKATLFIPVRFASVIEVPEIGDFVVLRMRVGPFGYAKDLEVFNQELRNQSAEVPEWKDSSGGYPAGRHWIEIQNYPKSVKTSTSVSDWQNTIGQLAQRTDFKETGPFYRVSGLRQCGSIVPIAMSDEQFSLASAADYEMLVDHYINAPDPGKFQLEVQLSGRAAEFISGSKLQIDSPYDRHWVRFRTLEPVRDESIVFTILKKASGQDAAVEFNLPGIVRGNQTKSLWLGVLVGLLLAAPQIFTLLTNPASVTSPSRLPYLVALALFLNLAAGITAALNFRKPV